MRKNKHSLVMPSSVISGIVILLAILMPMCMLVLEPIRESKQEKTERTSTERVEGVAPDQTLDGITAADSTSIMEVHFIYVGQSDSTLIINGEHAMLIDAGDSSHGTAVQYYLQNQGVKQLDYLVLTHNDEDHIGGGDVVITKFDVDTIFMSNYERDSAAYRDVIQALDYKNLTWSTPEVGNTYALGDAEFTIIAPVDSYPDSNNHSIGLLLEKGDTRFLFTGDAEEEAEADIAAYCAEVGIDIQTDVYHAGHHGSSTSSSEVFLDAVQPVYALISCGRDNPYGYPHRETMKSFHKRGVQVFRTDEQGSIIATSDGKEISWSCERDDAAQDDFQVNVVTTYICNTNTLKFHEASCQSVKDILDKNKLESTESREELIARGYVPCKRCNP